jgi:hypothetical protein
MAQDSGKTKHAAIHRLINKFCQQICNTAILSAPLPVTAMQAVATQAATPEAQAQWQANEGQNSAFFL